MSLIPAGAHPLGELAGLATPAARTARAHRSAPGPRGAPLVGSAAVFGRDPRLALVSWAREYGPIVRFNLGPMVIHSVSHPEGVKHVLQTNNNNYVKAPRTGFLSDILGSSLLTMEGDAWRKRRRLAQPAFHRERLEELGRVMAAEARRMCERWSVHEGTGRSFDLSAEMMRVTLRLAGEALFGVDLGSSADQIGRSLPVVLDHIMARMNSILPLPLWLPTPGNRRFHAERRRLDAIVTGLLQGWRSGRVSPAGLMAMLMEARDEDTGERLTDAELRDEAMTLIFAGHETTANALTWTWWLLAQHPAAAERLRDEVSSVLGDRAPTAQDLPRLVYTQNAVKEAMRLMPPAWVIGRMPLADDEIDGYHIPAGSMMLLPSCVTHRDPAHWEDPDAFDPDRFAPERSASRHRMAYYPFSAGPRVCIGSNFSLMESTFIVAVVAQRFRLELDRKRPLVIEPSLTLRPKTGLWMTLHRVARR
jgi:cytochrome P450